MYNILVCYVLLLSHSNKIHGEWVISSYATTSSLQRLFHSLVTSPSSSHSMLYCQSH